MVSMILAVLCWYALLCSELLVWNISYRLDTSWRDGEGGRKGGRERRWEEGREGRSEGGREEKEGEEIGRDSSPNF